MSSVIAIAYQMYSQPCFVLKRIEIPMFTIYNIIITTGGLIHGPTLEKMKQYLLQVQLFIVSLDSYLFNSFVKN